MTTLSATKARTTAKASAAPKANSKAGSTSAAPKPVAVAQQPSDDDINPRELKGRLKLRRSALGMSQGDVAEKITFWNNKAQEWKTLSRSAYCMYESGEVVPDLDKINRLAEVLQCTPQWLAFALGERDMTVPEVEWDAKAKTFANKRLWNLDDDWLNERFDCPMTDLVLLMVDDFAPNMRPGDMAFVCKGQEPNRAGDLFAFIDGDHSGVQIAHLTRPSAKSPYRVYDADNRDHRDVPVRRLTVLGRVVGRMGGL